MNKYVDLKINKTDNYCCVHYPSAMSPDGIGYMLDVDGIEVFVIAWLLHKYLVVEIVKVFWNKDVDIPHYLQDIQTL